MLKSDSHIPRIFWRIILCTAARNLFESESAIQGPWIFTWSCLVRTVPIGKRTGYPFSDSNNEITAGYGYGLFSLRILPRISRSTKDSHSKKIFENFSATPDKAHCWSTAMHSRVDRKTRYFTIGRMAQIFFNSINTMENLFIVKAAFRGRETSV